MKTTSILTATALLIGIGLPAAAAEPPGKPAELKTVEERLSHRIDAEFVEVPFTDVIAYLHDQSQVQFRIDHRAFDTAGVGTDTPVTLHLKQVRIDTLLEFVLDDLGELDYGVRDGVVVVSSNDKFSQQRELQVYSCQKLLQNVEPRRPRPNLGGGFGGTAADAGGPGLGGGPGAVSTTHDRPLTAMEQLVDLISTSIKPESWDIAGGTGSITPFGDRLVVSNAPRVQRQIKVLLERLCENPKQP